MASKPRKEFLYPEEDFAYIRRFVCDVLLYTLPKCGLPETELPHDEENVYNRANFVELASATILAVSLAMRDTWRQMFVSRLKSSGLDGRDILTLLTQIGTFYAMSEKMTNQRIVALSLALCNEIIIFIHHENIDIYPFIIIELISRSILYTIQTTNVSETIEGLFGEFANASKYARWIANFTSKFAIPYASSDGVSALFVREDKKRHNDWVKMATLLEEPSIKKLKDYLGFLPHDVFVAIALEEDVYLPENLLLASELILPGDRESPEPPTLWPSCESGSVGRKKSRRRRLGRAKNDPKQATQVGKGSKKALDHN